MITINTESFPEIDDIYIQINLKSEPRVNITKISSKGLYGLEYCYPFAYFNKPEDFWTYFSTISREEEFGYVVIKFSDFELGIYKLEKYLKEVSDPTAIKWLTDELLEIQRYLEKCDKK